MDQAGFGNQYLMEGIGSTLGLLEEITPFFEHHYDLLCFKNYESSLTYPVNGDCEIITDILAYSKPIDLQIKIIPNPITPKSIIEIKGFDGKQIEVQVFNIIGDKIDEFVIKNNHTELNFDSYNSGIYFINVIYDDKIIGTKKFIKN